MNKKTFNIKEINIQIVTENSDIVTISSINVTTIPILDKILQKLILYRINKKLKKINQNFKNFELIKNE